MQTVDLETEESFIVFELDRDYFASSLADVAEVIEVPDIRPIPTTYDFLLGLANFRKRLLCVTDLRIKLGLAAKRFPENVVIVISGKGTMALLVDQLVAVAQLGKESLNTSILEGFKLPSSCMLGVVRYQDRIVPVLEPQRLFSEVELSDQSSFAKSA